MAIHICKSCRAPRNPEILGNVFHQHHVGLKITGNGTWELSDSGCYSLENITQVIFFALWEWFCHIQHILSAHFSFTAISGINIETAADRVRCCNIPNTSVHPCSDDSLWGDSVISSSLTLRASRFQPGQKWRSQVTEPIWERNSRRADRDCFNYRKEAEKGGRATLEQSNNIFPSWRWTVWGRIKMAEIVFLKECKNVDVGWLTNKGHFPLI